MLDEGVGDYAARALNLLAATSHAKGLVLPEDLLQLQLAAASNGCMTSSQVGWQEDRYADTLYARCVVGNEDTYACLRKGARS